MPWKYLALLIAVGITGLAVGIGIADHGGCAKSTSRSGAAAGKAEAAATSGNAIARELAILRRPRNRATDTIPSEYVAQLAQTQLSARGGAELAQARRAVGLHRGAVWVVPTTIGVCLLADWTEQDATGPRARPLLALSCEPSGSITDGGPVVTSPSDHARTILVAGIVPNGINTVRVHYTTGRHEILPVSENAYAAAVRGSASLSFLGPQDIYHHIATLRVPARPNTRCHQLSAIDTICASSPHA